MATSEPMLVVDRSESFTNGLLLNLWDMRTRGEMTDVTIVAANVRIPCHCNVMAAASTHFKTLLHGSPKEAARKDIELNFDKIYVQKVVEYCYTGKIHIELSQAKSYLRIAEYFHLSELKTKIEEFVCDHVSAEVCIGWSATAKEFSLRNLERKCREIMSNNFQEVAKHTEFHLLTARELIECIKLVQDADVVLESCVNWVTLNVQARSAAFLGFLNHVQLDQCSLQCLERVLQTWKPIWPNYREVQQAISPFTSATPRSLVRRRELIILLFGGYSENHVLNLRVWKMNLSAGTCDLFTIIDHGDATYWPGYCPTPDRVFVIGGSRAWRDDKLRPIQDCRAIPLQASPCETWPDIKTPVAEIVAVCVQDNIYTFGGDTSDKAVFVLNLKTKKWTRCPSMPVKNINPIIAAIREMVYMIFNTHPYNAKFKTSAKVTMYLFDTPTLTWSTLTPLPISIQNTRGATAVSADDDVYLVGGVAKLCARYSPKRSTWTVLARPLVVHQAFSAVHLDGDIVLCGGCDHDKRAHSVIEVYNTDQDTWSVHSVRMPLEIIGHCCAVYDDEARKIVI